MREGDDDRSKAHRKEAPPAYFVEAEAVAELYGRLRTLTPRIGGTTLLMVLNVVTYLAMVVAGVDPMNPTADSLIDWGANYGPRTAGGQWWRLFSSMFLHVGAFHLVMNMWALLSLGRLVERALGTPAFMAAYVLSGWAGSLVSVTMKPFTVSAGASGAIFGLFGVLLAFVLRPRRSIPVAALRPLRNSAFVFIGFNLWIGLTSTRIDLAAHLGGFVFGFVCGALLGHELSTEARRAIRGRTALLACAGGATLALATWSLQGRVADLVSAFADFDQVETRVLAVVHDAESKKGKGELSDDAFADVIERDVLPPWRAVGPRLAKLHGVPREQRAVVRQLEQYQRLREEGWELMARGSRARDAAEVARGNEKQGEAEKLSARIGKP